MFAWKFKRLNTADMAYHACSYLRKQAEFNSISNSTSSAYQSNTIHTSSHTSKISSNNWKSSLMPHVWMLTWDISIFHWMRSIKIFVHLSSLGRSTAIHDFHRDSTPPSMFSNKWCILSLPIMSTFPVALTTFSMSPKMAIPNTLKVRASSIKTQITTYKFTSKKPFWKQIILIIFSTFSFPRVSNLKKRRSETSSILYHLRTKGNYNISLIQKS